ncbi:concanavalin A-like lectin/glucanase domain-containing protein [Zopfochytrium polystomum]|nr:concanavalin A-like lectin/glucanase domain-containing protein [Zopfochytrium polystomum]
MSSPPPRSTRSRGRRTSPKMAAAAGAAAAAVATAAAVLMSSPAAYAADTFDPATTGNCLSGTYNFDPKRMYKIPSGQLTPIYPPVLPGLDWSAYDFTVDYGATNVNLNVTNGVAGGVGTRVNAATKAGTRISTSRYILYGKFSIKMKATPASAGGIVSTFITMSDRGDEIDWEILPAVTKGPATTNVFYNRVLEFGVHDGSHSPPSGSVDTDYHEYTIDWNRERIVWSIDGTAVRTYEKANSYETSVNGYYYPSTPSLVQLGSWDGGDSSSAGTASWAGGPVSFGSNDYLETAYGPLTIQCYDDNDKPVDMWPVTGNKGKTTATASSSAASSTKTSTTATGGVTKSVAVRPEQPTSTSYSFTGTAHGLTSGAVSVAPSLWRGVALAAFAICLI